MRSALLLPLLLVGCAANVSASEADEALCVEASAHVEACLGEAPAASSCDGRSAEQLLSMSCEEVIDAKADGPLSDLLCFFGFRSYCAPTPAPGPVGPLYTISGTVQRAETLAPVSGLVVQVTDNYLHFTDFTDADGAFTFDLSPGTYYLAVYDGAVRLHERTFVVSEATSFVVTVP